MHYLIDGHNLISKLPDIHLDDPDDEAKLALRLKSWVAARQKRRVTLFFDGGLLGGKSQELSGGGVTVIFAPADRTADALIIHRLQQVRHPAEHTVVSSDHEILAAAGRRRVPTITAEAFARQLSLPQPEQEPADAAGPVLSEADVVEWLAIFGPEPAPKSRRRQRPSEKPLPASPAENKPAGSPSAASAKEGSTQPPLNVVKRTSEKLSEEEVAAWLELFNQSEPDG
jgi:uncharacterized protein